MPDPSPGASSSTARDVWSTGLARWTRDRYDCRMWRQRRVVPLRLLAAGLLTATVLTGCTAAPDGDVEDAAARFADAVAAGDGTEACRLLAPRTKSELEANAGEPCRDGIVKEMPSRPGGAESVRVEVFGTAARARTGRDTMFLARFQGGWKVSAAGCTSTPSGIYECVLKGS